MALPALSLAAQAMKRSGAPAALAKYGAKAVLKKLARNLDDMARYQKIWLW